MKIIEYGILDKNLLSRSEQIDILGGSCVGNACGANACVTNACVANACGANACVLNSCLVQVCPAWAQLVSGEIENEKEMASTNI